MSDYMNDISSFLNANPVAAAGNQPGVKKKDEGMGLNMQDFLSLMVAELQNQSIDSTADTSEMLNQMVMMQMVSALTNMTDASVMGYAASLVGKTVTVGQADSEGKLEEIVGTVTGTGSMNGSQVIFINDKYYYLNEIMAVGTLPKAPQSPETADPKDPTAPADPAPVLPDVTEPQKPEQMDPETQEVPDSAS